MSTEVENQDGGSHTSDWNLFSNVEVKVELDSSEKKMLIRYDANFEENVGEEGTGNSSGQMTFVDTSNTFLKSKLLLEELSAVFTKCEQDCGHCDKLIFKLHKHILRTHGSTYQPQSSQESSEFIVGFPTSSNNFDAGNTSKSTFSLPFDVSDFSDMRHEPIDIDSNSDQPETNKPGSRPSHKNKKLVKKFKLSRKPIKIKQTKIQGKCLGTKSAQHEVNNRFKCRICQMSFSIKTHYEDHFKIHVGEKPYMCVICSASFRILNGLERHIAVAHTGDKPFKCETCEKEFFNSKELSMHVTSHTGEKPYTCKVCGQCFRFASTLSAHKLIHTGEKKYACAECGKRFLSSSGLNRHKSMHIEIKLFTCETCGKSFKNRSNLTFHNSTVHTEEKRYTCEICGKKFSRASHLKQHSAVHSDEKPERLYSCEVCGKTFTTATNLKIHSVVHTGEKPYSCDMCEKSFGHNSSLKAHKKAHAKL